MSDEERPEDILKAVEGIMNGAGTSLGMQGLMSQLTPRIVVAEITLKQLQKAGFRRKTAEKMILMVWADWYLCAHEDDDDGYDDDSDDD